MIYKCNILHSIVYFNNYSRCIYYLYLYISIIYNNSFQILCDNNFLVKYIDKNTFIVYVKTLYELL